MVMNKRELSSSRKASAFESALFWSTAKKKKLFISRREDEGYNRSCAGSWKRTSVGERVNSVIPKAAAVHGCTVEQTPNYGAKKGGLAKAGPTQRKVKCKETRKEEPVCGASTTAKDSEPERGPSESISTETGNLAAI